MSKNLQPVRGTHDCLPEQHRLRNHILAMAREVTARYGCGEIATPIFEFTEVFARTLGDASDIVMKEMYTFDDRGGESITLRPEFTAGIARALISGGLSQHLPLKLFATGPIFRYERPQKGRLRQFHQLDVEYLGLSNPLADAEVIALGYHLLQALGLAPYVTLEINSLGDAESRTAYREALVGYFTTHQDALSEDSQLRLQRNPLRILDSKDAGDKALVAGAPQFGEYLNEASQQFFAEVKAGLEALGIPYVVNPRLVRGMDYYSHTAFEFVTDVLGSQGTVLAGGRYDALVKSMGGPDVPAVGWGCGLERLELLLEEVLKQQVAASAAVAVIPVGEAEAMEAFKLAATLRQAGLVVQLDYSGNMKKRLMRADKAGCYAAVIVGSDELAQGVVQLRDLKAGEHCMVAPADVATRLRATQAE